VKTTTKNQQTPSPSRVFTVSIPASGMEKSHFDALRRGQSSIRDSKAGKSRREYKRDYRNEWRNIQPSTNPAGRTGKHDYRMDPILRAANDTRCPVA